MSNKNKNQQQNKNQNSLGNSNPSQLNTSPQQAPLQAQLKNQLIKNQQNSANIDLMKIWLKFWGGVENLLKYFSKKLGDFFIWASGANIAILEQCTQNERIKYIVLGTLVVIISCFAFLSGTYAVSQIFDEGYLAIIIGFIWGMFIFSIDRFLIMIAPKKKHYIEDTTLTNFWQKIWHKIKHFSGNLGGSFWIRLPLVIVISVVVSKPIELRLMEKEINQMLLEKRANKSEEFAQKKEEIRTHYDSLTTIAEDIITQVNNEKPKGLEEINQEIQIATTLGDRSAANLNAQIRYIYNQISNTNDPNTLRSLNSQAAGLQKQIKDAYAQKDMLIASKNKMFANYIAKQERITTEQNEKIKNLIIEREKKLSEAEANIDMSNDLYAKNGLVARMTAFRDVAANDDYLATISTFLMIFFMCIEIIPVLAKSFMSRGLYEDLLEQQEEKINIDNQFILDSKKIENQEEISRLKLAQKKNITALEHEQELIDTASRIELDNINKAHEYQNILLQSDVDLAKKAKEEEARLARKLYETKQMLHQRNAELSNNLNLANKEQDWAKIKADNENAIKRMHLLNEEENNAQIRLKQQINKDTIEVEALNNKKILKKISDAHLEIVEQQVENWLDEQKANLI